MTDPVPAGDGAPPVQATPGPLSAPAQQAEGANVSVLDYAHRKLRQRESTGPKAAKGRPTGAAQKQPSTPEASPVSDTVLSQTEVAKETAKADPVTGIPATAPQDLMEEVIVAEPAQEEPSDETQSPEADDSSPEELPGDAPDWIRKRIARFTRQKGELERKLAEIETERTALKAEVARNAAEGPREAPLPIVVNQADPASQFVTEQQLDQAATQARQLKRWCERNPEGGVLQVPNKQGGFDQREFSAEQVQSMREAAEDDLDQHLPKRREHLRTEQSITSQAVKDHPWLTDKVSPRLATFRKVLEADPSIRLRPDWARVAAIYVRGLEAVEAEAKAAAAPPALPKPKVGAPPLKLPGPSATAPARKGPIASGQAEIAAAEKEWREAPSQQSFARLQTLKRQHRTQQSAA